jgi:hypothetical protein
MHTGEILFLTLVVGTFVIFSATLAMTVAAYERSKPAAKTTADEAASEQHAHA